jgi:hypothetical protein
MLGAQCSVFCVQSSISFTMMELAVTDDLTFTTVQRPGCFPKLIIITKGLSFDLPDFQMISLSPFRVSIS